MATKKVTTKAADTSKPVNKAPNAKKVEAKAPKQTKEVKVEKKKVETKAAPAKTAAKAPAKPAATKAAPKAKKTVDVSKISAAKPATKAKAETTSDKTVYHVSKRDRDGREWKVFIQESDKVIKLFKTQAEALDYAKDLAKNKGNGSYVVLHGLDGKIRKF